MIEIKKYELMFKTAICNIRPETDLKAFVKEVKEHYTELIAVSITIDGFGKLRIKDHISDFGITIDPEKVIIVRKEYGMYYMSFNWTGIIVKIPLEGIRILKMEKYGYDTYDKIIKVLVDKSQWVIE